jgi:hypothetical protein
MTVTGELLPDETGNAWGREEPRPARPAPFPLGEPYFVTPATLTNITLGKQVANVTATIALVLHAPYDGFTDLMGEHALAATLGGSYLGNGIRVVDAVLHADVENEIIQKLKLTMPRYDGGIDQLATFVAPFLEDPSIADQLLAYSGAWRLNLPVKIEGDFALYEPQQRFDLTKRADDD